MMTAAQPVFPTRVSWAYLPNWAGAAAAVETNSDVAVI